MIAYIKLNGRLAFGTQAEADREMERIRQYRLSPAAD